MDTKEIKKLHKKALKVFKKDKKERDKKRDEYIKMIDNYYLSLKQDI